MISIYQWWIQDIPRGGVANHSEEGGGQHKILPKFPENCMKEFGCGGGGGALRSGNFNTTIIKLSTSSEMRVLPICKAAFNWPKLDITLLIPVNPLTTKCHFDIHFNILQFRLNRYGLEKKKKSRHLKSNLSRKNV